MKITKGIALKLIILILTSTFIIFASIFVYNYIFTKRMIKKNIENNAETLAQATVNRIETVLRSIEKVPLNLAKFLEDLNCRDQEIMGLIKSVVKNNPEIYGATIAFEPYARARNIKKFAPYYYKRKDRVNFTFIPYDYFYYDWYQIPKMLNRPVWSEPYYDRGAGNIIMSTYSVPFYGLVDGRKRFMGVVTADVSLEWLRRIVSSIRIGKTGYGFLITKNGTFVTHPISQLIMNETIFTIAQARNDKRLRKIGRRMIKGMSGYEEIKSIVTRKDCWLVYKPLPSSSWTLGVLFPKKELMADVVKLNNMVLILGIVGFVGLFLIIIMIANSIANPLRKLSEATESIAKGNLDTPVPEIRSKDEVGALADSFRYMQESLKKYIKELTETVAEKERIESELKIARDIQMGILPKEFPPFPDRKEIDIYAVLEPAREVGGDFYDFFFVDDDHLSIAIGDVSGKGVPAAIFMSLTKSLLRAKATQGLSPELVLRRLNEDICLNNPSLLFVTVFFGMLNVRTGEFRYSNAGHNPPYLIHSDGRVELLPATGNIAIGVMEDAVYDSRTISLKKGDRLFLYTDGVTEAMNERNELFSDKRLEKELSAITDMEPKSMIESIMKDIKVFCGTAPQSDDITILSLIFNK